MSKTAGRRRGGLAPETRRTLGLVLLLAAVAPTLVSLDGIARDRQVLEEAPPAELMDLDGVQNWIRQRFTEEEFRSLRGGQLNIEPHFCSCEDQPDPHYPYPVVLFNTPKGDLVARAEAQEHGAKFTPLAVRKGEQYCEVGSEENCYGSFSSPCHFTDFRFGKYLEDFFPSCK